MTSQRRCLLTVVLRRGFGVSESNITKSTIFEPQVCASFGRLPRCCWLRIGTDSDPSLSGTQISSKSRCQPEVGFCIIWPISLLITWNCDFAFLFFSNRRSHNHDKRSPMGSEGSIVASSTFWGKTDGDAAAERCFCTLSGANPLKKPNFNELIAEIEQTRERMRTKISLCGAGANGASVTCFQRLPGDIRWLCSLIWLENTV